MRVRPILALLVLVTCLCGALVLLAARPRAAQPDDNIRSSEAERTQTLKEKTELQKFMRGKLEGVDQVVEGLVMDNFDMIKDGADKLAQISDAAKWRVSNNAMYRQYSVEYQRKVDRLGKTAKAKNLDGAALAYVGVTMSCIDCHKWVRTTLVADRGL